MIKKILLSLLVLYCSTNFNLLGQGACGFDPSSKEIAYIDNLMATKSPFSKTMSGVLVSIPVKFHLIRRSDGTGGMTQEQADNLLIQVNEFYECTNMSFKQSGELNYIDNDEYFDMNSANEEVLAGGNDVSKVINLYFFNSLRSGSSPLCGYTRFPPSSDRVFLVYGCVLGGGTTLEHELGHYFTLFHTHGTTNTGTTDELVNQSNCASAGDRLCDTPADPNLSGQVTNCVYTGTAVDANGQLYQPDPRNVMSYAPDNCGPYISTGQCDRARNGFENGRSYLSFSFEDFGANFLVPSQEICVDNSVSFSGISFGASSWSWEFEGGTPATSTIQNPVIGYNIGGEFTVKLKVTNGSGQEVEVIREKYITVTDPLGESIDSEINYSFDNAILPTEVKIENNDEGVTFEYSPVNNGVGSGSLFINNFDYNSDATQNIDQFYFPYLNYEGVSKFDVSFDYAYAPRKGKITATEIFLDVYDSLTLRAETECGTDKSVTIWGLGKGLETVVPQDDAFVPSNSSEWKSANVSLNRKAESEEFANIYFTSTSNNGNNLYIDNIVITPDYSVVAPTNLARGASSIDSDVVLRWNHTAFNELGFVVERARDNGAFEKIAELAKNVTTYTDSNIESGFEYSYRVRAFSKKDTESDNSNILVVSDFKITGIDKNPIVGLNIFPNPASNQLNLKIRNSEKGKLDIRIYSITGQLIKAKQYSKFNDEFDVSLNLENFKNAIYIMKITLGDRISTKKINVVK
jgi:PKD repeat protein